MDTTIQTEVLKLLDDVVNDLKNNGHTNTIIYKINSIQMLLSICFEKSVNIQSIHSNFSVTATN
jgi:hypothetical protein